MNHSHHKKNNNKTNNKWELFYDQLAREHGASAQASLYMNDRSFYLHQQRTLGWIGSVQGKRILDVGCGTGLFIQPLVKDNQVTGMDVSSEALQIAAQNGIQECLHCTLEEAPVSKESYDLIFCIGTLQCMKDPQNAVERLKELVVPGGHLIIETLNARSILRWALEKITSKKNYEQTICPQWLHSLVVKGGDFQLESRLNFYLPLDATSTVQNPGWLHELAVGTYAMKWTKR